MLEVPAVTLATVPGFETAVFSFTTDIPFLNRWGMPLLFGPGSIRWRTPITSRSRFAELHAAVDRYVELATALLAQEA